jgi:hypothetical protein
MTGHPHPHPHDHEHAPHPVDAHDLSDASDQGLTGIIEQAYAARAAATAVIVAALQEQIGRAVWVALPSAATVVLYEDRSHDAPHAHVRAVLDADGATLADGTGDWWHEQDWTGNVDELVWDLYHLDPAGFHSSAGERIRNIPVAR